eukprot:TRINITY_DN14317_c0_g1_i1.p1 TRINITY_DN14317_c0_g1~~TRINITY_DN14317_c0_g1_i1.p1  ORF type:complete len:274 (-),score=103.13 TRINITY_DN14317_c0_g1_i1:181-1002(-)
MPKGKEEKEGKLVIEDEEEMKTIDTTGDPQDRITVAEKSQLEEMKKSELTEGFDDKTLMIFLIARNHSVPKALERLASFRKWFKEHGYEGRVVKKSDLNPKLLESLWSFGIPGAKSKKGGLITYLIPGNIMLKEYKIEEIFDFLVYSWEMISNEPLSSHRNGAIYVEDISNMGLKNMDMSKNGKMKDIQSAFPIKVSAILIMKPGMILRALMTVAKLFVKTKIINRTVALKKSEQIFDWVDASQLHESFGGNLKFSLADFPENPMEKSENKQE